MDDIHRWLDVIMPCLVGSLRIELGYISLELVFILLRVKKVGAHRCLVMFLASIASANPSLGFFS